MKNLFAGLLVILSNLSFASVEKLDYNASFEEHFKKIAPNIYQSTALHSKHVITITDENGQEQHSESTLSAEVSKVITVHKKDKQIALFENLRGENGEQSRGFILPATFSGDNFHVPATSLEGIKDQIARGLKEYTDMGAKAAFTGMDCVLLTSEQMVCYRMVQINK